MYVFLMFYLFSLPGKATASNLLIFTIEMPLCTLIPIYKRRVYVMLLYLQMREQKYTIPQIFTRAFRLSFLNVV